MPQEELFAGCRTQPGFVCTKSDLTTDARNFRYSGVFQDIQVRTVEKDGKVTSPPFPPFLVSYLLSSRPFLARDDERGDFGGIMLKTLYECQIQ